MQKLRSTGFAPALLGLTALIAIGCGEKDEGAVPPPTTNNNNPSVTPDSGSTTPATTTDSGSTASTNTGGTDAGTKPTIRPTMDASVPALDAQAPAADAASVDAGSVDGGGTGAPLKIKCEGGERMGCSSFMSPSGMEVQFGKYGAAMDYNVGKEFANPVDEIQESTFSCGIVAATFGQSQEETDKVLDTKDLDFGLYTVFRPANWVPGEKYPIISWGNGTCAQPEGYGTLLRYIASQGFVVFAANSRWVGNDGAAAMKRAIDFAFKSNMDPMSPYYQKLDTTKVGAAGHSQGGGATQTVSSDARIGSVILFNGGSKAAKPYMTVSGERDLGGQTAASLKAEVESMPKAAFLFFHMIPGTGSSDGHLTLMKQPERLMDQTVDWFKMMLNGDAAAKANFVGASCKYCGQDAKYEYGQKGL